jgi:uncharacterized peroxidase-related enzyme
MSISPTVLTGWAGLQNALNKTLDAKARAGIALAVSESNGCDYNLAAHSHVAMNTARMSPDEISLNRKGRSSDPRRHAAARFAKRLIEKRGKVAHADLAALRRAGFSDPQVVEIIALSAQYLLTNFMNNAADTAVDFPRVAPAKATAFRLRRQAKFPRESPIRPIRGVEP